MTHSDADVPRRGLGVTLYRCRALFDPITAIQSIHLLRVADLEQSRWRNLIHSFEHCRHDLLLCDIDTVACRPDIPICSEAIWAVRSIRSA
jgi:hypothetical protein